MVGVIAFCMTLVEEYLLEKKSEYTISLLSEDTSIAYAYFYWVSFSLICALIAVILTVYVGPGAMGSGVPEVMGLLNGVNYPNAINISTLVVKIIGVEFAVIGNLAI